MTTSVNTLSSAAIQIAPNPSSGFLNFKVQTDLSNDLLVKIHNFQGQEIYSNVLDHSQGASLIWTNDHLPNGIYMIQFLELGKVVGYRKIVLQ